MIKMKRILCFVVALALVLSACEKKSSEKKITSFAIGDMQYLTYLAAEEWMVIDEVRKTISFSIPDDWDISSLYVTYRLSGGATGSLLRDEKIDFSQPVPFVITAEDGSTVTYTITLSVFGIKMLSFSFNELDPPVHGVFKYGTATITRIDLTVPFHTDITALTPTMVVSEGANVYTAEYGVSPVEYIPAKGVPFDFTKHCYFYVINDLNNWCTNAYYADVIISPLKIDQVNKTSFAPGEQLTLTGSFAASGNIINLKKGLSQQDITPQTQSVTSLVGAIPASLALGQYTLSVISHDTTASYPEQITIAIPAGQPWITGLDKTEYQIGEPLVITGVNFPSEIAQIYFMPVGGGTNVITGITIKSGTRAELDKIPNLNPSVAYVVSIYFKDSDSDTWSNAYPITIK
jgi:hypothetical protein